MYSEPNLDALSPKQTEKWKAIKRRVTASTGDEKQGERVADGLTRPTIERILKKRMYSG